MQYSIVVPVYNRPDEVDELLRSLTVQSYQDFEVIIVEDGSVRKCDAIAGKYESRLDIHYYYKANSGPALSRNYGAERSRGDYLIFFDSDCIIPPDYLAIVTDYLKQYAVPAYGGPDRAHPDFTRIQKAINYGMTSFFTTGGIRGGKKRLDRFYPRTFNFGIDKEAFNTLGGFSNMRFGEDVDLSIRIYKSGYSCALIREAWVYHKRRTNLKKFFKQVFNSGIARFVLYKKYPDSLKVVHLLPGLFVLFFIFTCLAGLFYPVCFLPLLFYFLLIFIDSSVKEKSFAVGALAVSASFVQLFAYGCGFFYGIISYAFLKQHKTTAFDKTFYQ